MSFARYERYKDSGVEWRDGLKDILLGPARLYENLRLRGDMGEQERFDAH